MKVFLSGTSLLMAYGGPAFSVSRLATALDEHGVEVCVWTPDGSAETTTLIDSSSGVIRLGGSVKEALMSFGCPDIIHDNGLWLSHNHSLAVIAAKRGIPRVVSTRGMLEPWAMNHKKWKKQIAWPAYQKNDLSTATAIHATSQPEKKNLDRLELGVPVDVIPNGVDIPDLSNKTASLKSVRTALYVGRLYPVKGLPILIDSWARVRPEGWRLVIAGPDEGGHRAELERLVRDRRLGDVVAFVGPVDVAKKNALFLDADLFVLPSHSESFGMAIAEALSFSLPVLTTTAAPWPELDDAQCGWRVAANEAAFSAGLGHAISRSVSDLEQMGARGRQLVTESYNWPRIAQSFVSFYTRAIGR